MRSKSLLHRCSSCGLTEVNVNTSRKLQKALLDKLVFQLSCSMIPLMHTYCFVYQRNGSSRGWKRSTCKLPEATLKLLQHFLVLCSLGKTEMELSFNCRKNLLFDFEIRLSYIVDSVTWVTEGRSFMVWSVSWVRCGTDPKCVYSRHPGVFRECCPVLPSPFRTPNRPFPWTTRDSSSFILLPAIPFLKRSMFYSAKL